MKTQTTTARQAQQEEDLFLKGFYGVLSLIVKLLRYIGRRTIQHPLVGLLYLVVAFPAAFLIVQDLRLWSATALAPRFTQPASIWPLSEPLQPLGVALLAGVIISVCVIDRRVAQGSATRTARDKSIQAPVKIDEWVLGRSYERTWNPDPGEFELRETTNLYRLTEEHLRTHMIVIAPPGGGKTRSVLKPALHMFKRTGAAVICIDAKAKTKTSEFTDEDFHLTFNPDDPGGSMRLSVWSGRTPREMGERLAEALVPEPSSEEKKYFSRNAKAALGGFASAHHAAYGEMPSLRQMLLYLRNPAAREDLVEEMRNQGLSDASPEGQDLSRINGLIEQKTDPLGGLDNALAPLARGEIADLLTTARDGYSIEQLVRESVRVRFALSVGDRPSVAPILGRLILAQFTHAVISPNCNSSILKAAMVNEAHEFITPAIATGMAMARENRGCYILAMQDLSQIEDPTLRENILSVAGNKMVMGGVGDYDAKKFSALFGTRERRYTTHSQSTSQGKHSSQSRGSGHGGHGGYGGADLLNGSLGAIRQQSTSGKSSSHQQSEGSSVQVRERAEFLTSEIRGLPRFHVLIERRDSKGEMTPATLVHLDINTITDTSTEQALRLYKETGHLEGALPKLPLIRGDHVPANIIAGSGAEHSDETTVQETALPSHLVDVSAEAVRTNLSKDSASEVSNIQVGGEPTSDSPTTLVAGSTPEATESSAEQFKITQEEGSSETASTPYPDWVETSTRAISSTLHIARPQAQELTRQAYRNGRNARYIADNIAHAKSATNVKSPVGLFIFMVRENRHKPRPDAAEEATEEESAG